MRVKTGFEMTLAYLLHSAFRFLQLILALTVCGLYGVDLSEGGKVSLFNEGKWVYAEVVASLSAVTALVYLIPFIVHIHLLFVWDTILFILWITLFGVFGDLYIGVDAKGDSGVHRMKNAVWVDLTSALLWLISAVGMVVFWLKNRNNRTRWTGRATV